MTLNGDICSVNNDSETKSNNKRYLLHILHALVSFGNQKASWKEHLLSSFRIRKLLNVLHINYICCQIVNQNFLSINSSLGYKYYKRNVFVHCRFQNICTNYLHSIQDLILYGAELQIKSQNKNCFQQFHFYFHQSCTTLLTFLF